MQQNILIITHHNYNQGDHSPVQRLKRSVHPSIITTSTFVYMIFSADATLTFTLILVLGTWTDSHLRPDT